MNEFDCDDERRRIGVPVFETVPDIIEGQILNIWVSDSTHDLDGRLYHWEVIGQQTRSQTKILHFEVDGLVRDGQLYGNSVFFVLFCLLNHLHSWVLLIKLSDLQVLPIRMI